MKRSKSILGIFSIISTILPTACSGGTEPLKELADCYAQIGVNEEKYAEGYRALYSLPRDKQEAGLNSLNAQCEEWQAENQRLAEKAAGMASKLQGTTIGCKSSDAMGLTIEKAEFTTVNAQDKVCNIVITVTCAEPASRPYCFMEDKDGNLLWKTPATYNNGSFSINFRLTRNQQEDEVYGKLNHILVVTESEYNANSAGVSSNTELQAEPEPAYQGDDASDNLESAQTPKGEIKVGENLKAALLAASNVTYDYDADSGIWAIIGNIAIVIDDDQLTQAGIDFMAAITSDIAPNIAFKPEYVKPDAKILQIEAL